MSKLICSGGLFLARDTKRFLLVCRTQEKTLGEWGLVGGKKEPGDITAVDVLNREIKEEIGETQPISKLIPLEQYTSLDQNFQYNTYVLIVDHEFIPTLNSEHSGYSWSSLGHFPKPLHQGLRYTLNNRSIRNKLELILSLI